MPIIGAPGTGYSLMEGYFLPPISFTVEEAVTLLIGTDFIEQRFDDEYRVRAQAARRKIEAILSESVRNETSRVRKALRLLAPGKRVALSKEREYFEKIRRAILVERKIRFHYSKGIADSKGSHHSDRTVAPFTGNLILHGVTKPITFYTAFEGLNKDPRGRERAGFHSTASIERNEFGLTFNSLLETGGIIVGNEVKIELYIEVIKID